MAESFSHGDRVCYRWDLLRSPGTVQGTVIKADLMVWVRWDGSNILSPHFRRELDVFSPLDELAHIETTVTWKDRLIRHVRRLIG